MRQDEISETTNWEDSCEMRDFILENHFSFGGTGRRNKPKNIRWVHAGVSPHLIGGATNARATWFCRFGAAGAIRLSARPFQQLANGASASLYAFHRKPERPAIYLANRRRM